MNRAIKKPTAKETGSRIRKRSFELAFGGKTEKNIIYAWILLLILSIVLTFIVQSWAVDIQPARVELNVGVSLTRLDRDRLEVMIISIEKDTNIEYLTYYTSRGAGYINKSSNPPVPVRDAGESGIIPVSGYDEHVEIFATLQDTRIKIFNKTV